MKTQKKRNLAIIIAKDVIANLNAKHFYATQGQYCVIPGISNQIRTGVGGSRVCNLQTYLKTLKEEKKPCGACALGSMFLAKVDRFNKCDIDNTSFGATNDYLVNVANHLTDAFTKHELGVIEAAFETRRLGLAYKMRKSTKKAITFGSRFNDADVRLRAIMKNIIDNNGEFLP